MDQIHWCQHILNRGTCSNIFVLEPTDRFLFMRLYEHSPQKALKRRSKALPQHRRASRGSSCRGSGAERRPCSVWAGLNAAVNSASTLAISHAQELLYPPAQLLRINSSSYCKKKVFCVRQHLQYPPYPACTPQAGACPLWVAPLHLHFHIF